MRIRDWSSDVCSSDLLTPSFPPVAGQQVLVHAVADSLSDVTALRVWLDGQELTLDADGRATITVGQPGKYELTATVTDADGGTKTIVRQLKVRDPADRSAPVVALSNGIAGSIFDGAASVAGSVTDSSLEEHTSELQSLIRI